MALDANELKARVRDFIQMEGWSMSRLAKSAGLRPSTLQDAANRTWNPTSETLQACMDVVNSQIPREPRPEAKPVAHTLPIAFLSKPWNREFSDCMEIWRSQNGQFSELLFQKLGTTRMGERLSAVRVGEDNRMRMARFGSQVFGSGFSAGQSLLSDMPDQKLFEWIEDRMWEVIRGGEPVFSACVTPVESDALGLYDVPYTTLALPCVSQSDGVIDAVVTINRLEPSEYRDRVTRIAP